MLELGPNSAEFHRDLGKYIYKSGVEVLVTIGEKAQSIYDGYLSLSENLTDKKDMLKNAYHFEDKNVFYNRMYDIIKTGDTILLKGSRANRMEELIDNL